MKRMLITSLAAYCVVLASQQQASAWSKFRLGIGLNISWEGANNSFLGGLFKSGPAPAGYDPYYDGGPMHGPGPYSQGGLPDAFAQPANGGQPNLAAAQPGVAQPVGYYSYPQAAYGNYAAPVGYGQYQAPSYWYGR